MATNIPNKKFNFDVDKNSDIAKKLRRYLNKDREYVKMRLLSDIAFRIVLWFKYCRCDYFDENVMKYDKLVSNFLRDYELGFIEKETILKDVELILKDKYNISIITKEPLVLSFDGTFNDIEI